MRNSRRRLGLILSLAVMLALPWVGPAEAQADALAGDCFVTANRPHLSSTPGKGIDAKSSFACDGSASMTVTSVLISLYLRTRQPPQGSSESSWTSSYGCRVVQEGYYPEDFVASSAVKPVRMVPRPPAEAHGSGYWAQCTQWSKNGVVQPRKGAIAIGKITG